MSGGRKDDQGKPSVLLIPNEALTQIALALDFGAKKYGTYNFTKGMLWSRMLNAAGRHLYQYMWESKTDKESGLSHLAHLGACVVMLLWHEAHKPDLDDTFVNHKNSQK